MNSIEQVLDWRGRGYYRFPFRSSPPNVDEAFVEDWNEFEHHLERSKSGIFSDPTIMWSHARRTRSWQVAGAYRYLLGHTSPPAFLRELRSVALNFRDFGAAVDAAHILAISGLLSEIPPLVAFIGEFLDIGEFAHAFWSIARLLDDGTQSFARPDVLENLGEDGHFQAYAAQVEEVHRALSSQLHTDRVRIFRGALFDIRTLVQRMRAHASGTTFDPKLREQFEAATGIDCSNFYVDHVAQPQRIHGILQELEDSGSIGTFLPGRRYFFGHLVPE